MPDAEPSISDYEMLETRDLTLANGLPIAIVDMIHQISHIPVISKDVIRDVYHEAGVHYPRFDQHNIIYLLDRCAFPFRRFRNQ